MSDKIALEQVTEQYEYAIQVQRDKHTLRDRQDTVLVESGTWEACVDKLIEILGDVEVSHVVVANTVLLRQGDWDG